MWDIVWVCCTLNRNHNQKRNINQSRACNSDSQVVMTDFFYVNGGEKMKAKSEGSSSETNVSTDSCSVRPPPVWGMLLEV